MSTDDLLRNRIFFREAHVAAEEERSGPGELVSSSDSSADEESDDDVPPEIAFVNQHADRTHDESSDDESTLEDVELKVFTRMILQLFLMKME